MFVAKTQFLCEHNYVPVEKDDTKCLNIEFYRFN